MELRFEKKIVESGKSSMIIIPAVVAKMFHLYKGEKVEIIVNETGFTVKHIIPAEPDENETEKKEAPGDIDISGAFEVN